MSTLRLKSTTLLVRYALGSLDQFSPATLMLAGGEADSALGASLSFWESDVGESRAVASSADVLGSDSATGTVLSASASLSAAGRPSSGIWS